MLLLFNPWYDVPSGKRSRKISPEKLSLGEKVQSGTPASPSTSPASFTGCYKHPIRLWCLYPWLVVLWPQSLTAGGTHSSWNFLCQASSIHRFIVLSKLEKFSVIISQKYFDSPILCSFHIYIFFLGVHLRLSLSVQSHLSACHVQPAADSAHCILHIIVSSLNIWPFSLELISLNSMRH